MSSREPESLAGQMPRGAVRSGTEMVLRVLFGFFLAGVALAALFYDPWWFAGLTALMTLFAAREWHRMVRAPEAAADAARGALHVQTIVTGLAIVAAIGVLLARWPQIAFAVLAVGAVASFAVALRRQDNPAWHAIGVLYLGIPALALVSLRIYPPQGALLLLGMFLIVWSTDTGALVFGKLIGGARIAPRLSPGKTWAGTIGGSICAALVFGVYIGFFGFRMLPAMAFAFVFSFAAHLGDLLESAIKRHFGRKDSGSMIPGHGGVLDRMDSTLLASVVLAIMVFGLHLNPMFGGRQ